MTDVGAPGVVGVLDVRAGAGAPVVLVGVVHVGVHVPGVRLVHDLRPHAVRLHGAVGAGQRHPVVHGLVHGQPGEQRPGASRPDYVGHGGPDVLRLRQLGRDLPAPLGRLGVAQVEQVCVRRQGSQCSSEQAREVTRRLGIVLEHQQRPLGAAAELQAAAPGADVRQGTTSLARTQLQLAGPVRVQVVPALPLRSQDLVACVPSRVPARSDLGSGDQVAPAITGNQSDVVKPRTVSLQQRSDALHPVWSSLQVDHHCLQVLHPSFLLLLLQASGSIHTIHV
mmetsp:Transcript_110734/g.323980  ORF Transcript_110734/g.323980 Transcript_110734/m.323980 type:complete len:281 (-) Transcript_110734:118-960(-)